jgi:hypothetical protein
MRQIRHGNDGREAAPVSTRDGGGSGGSSSGARTRGVGQRNACARRGALSPTLSPIVVSDHSRDE